MLVLRVVLDCCAGKSWCYPGDEYLAGKTDLSGATISRCLSDLVDGGIIRIVRRRGGLRRYLVIASHPHAAEFLAEPGTRPWKSRRKPVASPPGDGGSDPSPRGIQFLKMRIPIPQNEDSSEESCRKLRLKPGLNSGARGRGISPLQRNDSEGKPPSTAPADDPRHSPGRLEGGTPSGAPRIDPGESPARTGPPEPPTHAVIPAPSGRRKLRGTFDPSEVPADDPIIARERARRDRARLAATADPPAPPPDDLLELIGRLPGAPASWEQRAAQGLVVVFGTREDQKLWGELHKIARCIAGGRLDPVPVLQALEAALGPDIANRGAYFWRALQERAGIDPRWLKDTGGTRHGR